MSGIYKVVDANGNVQFTDVPNSPGKIESIRPGTGKSDESQEKPYDPKVAEGLIREAQKRIPKLADYLNYLEYLRHNYPGRLQRVLDKLKEEDLEAWVKLQKHPQFRPLHQTVLGLNAAEKHLAAGIGLATGKFTGSFEKWMETTLRDMMKQSRWGGFADVLGSKATTLPAPKPQTYSNTPYGHYFKSEDARLAKAAKDVAKEGQLAKESLRAARGGAITRVGGSAMDVLFAAANPETARDAGVIALRIRIDKLAQRGVLDELQESEARSLLAARRYPELTQMLNDATNSYLKGR